MLGTQDVADTFGSSKGALLSRINAAGVHLILEVCIAVQDIPAVLGSFGKAADGALKTIHLSMLFFQYPRVPSTQQYKALLADKIAEYLYHRLDLQFCSSNHGYCLKFRSMASKMLHGA